MNSGFINRLVGTSIVVVAAIVFIPNILDGEKVHYKEGFKAIPERPEFTTVDLKSKINLRVENGPTIRGEAIEEVEADDEHLLEPAVKVAEVNSEIEADESETKNSSVNVSTTDATVQEQVKPAPEKVTVKSQPKVAPPVRNSTSNLTKMAYVIQLGSFSHKPNVDALVKKLHNAGFKAFTRPVKTPNGTLTKVFVGPDLDKTKLESKLSKLKELTKLNGRLTQFNIAK
ncbi:MULTISPECIES: SPOR domain-containing protein [Pseudoalteromonas]|uniref:DedD protein n=1 Tax=Pseudoalteromonas aurantia 208 TaxID=1314867 RepID=A0ABR9ED28_9GAMM|nr:SPOR domain-containing protein [Pseudoalteromonas aurantia]MBE0368875.1 DedD protein [Pseudoalteromonas aurantia 208]MBQ4846110.1 SPOR domain-containing protein [Pseudoalteromonas sp. MMG005]